jgi:hypothetical protein
MPNFIDLFRGNYNVNGMGGGLQINPLNYVHNPPNLDIDQNGVAAFLNVLEQATGIDLNAVNPSLATAISLSNQAIALATDASNAYQGTLAFLQQSWLNVQNIVNGVVGGFDADVTDFITAVNASITNAANAQQSWDIFFADIGFSVTNAPTFATWLASVANAGPWPGTTNADALFNRAIYKPSYLAIDATADSVFPASQITDATKIVTLTDTGSFIGYIGTPDAGLKQSVIWHAPNTAAGLTMLISVYSVDTSTGALTKMFTSTTLTTGAAGWNYYTIPTISQFTSVQGAWYAVEMMLEGNGASYIINGLPSHPIQVNTVATSFPQSLAASRQSITQPVFNQVGTGARTSGTTPVTTTGSFTAALGADVEVAVAAYGSTAVITGITVTYNGVSMSVAQFVNPNSSTSNGLLEVFRLAGAGTGTAKTVSITVTASSGSVFVSWLPFSYANVVSSLYASSTAASTGTALSITPSLTEPGTISYVAMMSVGALSSASIGTPSGATTRGTPWNSGGSDFPALLVCDTATAGAVTATAGVSDPWGMVYVTLYGTPALPPSTIAAPGPTFSPHVPWFGLGGTTGVPQHDPETVTFTTSGTYTVPTWMALGDLFDIVLLGDGGGGAPGSTIFAYGGGGFAGVWTGITLTYGVDIPLTTTSFTVTVGTGGAGGIIEINNGTPGSGCSVAITGYSSSPITTAGGANGSLDLAYFGKGSGNFVFNTTTYPGSGLQIISAAPGNPPGGGGSGGSYLVDGGNGAPGEVTITAYQ